MLIGIERYKSRSKDERKSAGVRTFAVIAALGAVCALLGPPLFTALVFGAIVLFLMLGYWVETRTSLGLTTEMAALLTFWLGYLVSSHESLVVATSIVLVMLLAHKQALHGFINKQMTEIELYDTLKFLIVVFVVLPLLPDDLLTPWAFVNPRELWLLVILVSTISYSGYVLVRLLGGKRGLQLNALVGGLVSTTAVTMYLAERARAVPQLSRLFGVTAVMANAVQAPRLLLLIWVVNPALGKLLALPLLGMFFAGIVGALILARVGHIWENEPPVDVLLTNPYSFWPALKFALLFAGVLVVSKAASHELGEQAIFVVSAVAGLADASAISLSVANMAKNGELTEHSAAIAVVIAVAVNASVKWGIALVNGTRSLAMWLGGGFLTMLAVLAGLLAVQII